MKVFIFLILILNFSFAQDKDTVETTTAEKERKMTIAIGIDEVVVFDYKYNSKIQVGDESKLGYTLFPKRQEITFKGLRPGNTSVIIRDAQGNIRDKFIVEITNTGKSETVQQLRELIGDVEGIHIGIKGGKVFVEGELVVPSDIGKVATVLNGYEDVLRLVEVSPQTQRIIARKIQDELSKNNMKDVTVRIINKVFWLEGVVNSEGKKELALKIAEAFIPGQISSLSSSTDRYSEAKRSIIQNFISVNEKKDPPPAAKQIKISAQFVELAKDYKRAFGFKWAPLMKNSGTIQFGRPTLEGDDGTSSGQITSAENNTLAGTIGQLFPKLSTAKEAGYARIIQSGMVITKNEVQASISKNKVIPFSIGSGEFTKADTAELKFSLSVTPKIADKEKIELQQLNINVDLPSGTTTDGKPVTTSNAIATNIIVKNKESAVIGGVVQNTSSTGYDKNDPRPYDAETLSQPDTSVLFNFMRSKAYVTEKSQFVVFVTPEIIQSASESTEEIRRKFKKRQR